MDIEALYERAKIIRNVRNFFDKKNYLECDTPLLSPDLIPESCLEVFETTLLPPIGSNRKKEPYWLIPSPEVWMKKLIARHGRSLYQICKCFRNGESTGRQHSPEFTMLEYYTMEADYRDSLRITEELFSFLLEGRDRADLNPPFIQISVEEAFWDYAGFDLFMAASSQGSMEEEAQRLGLSPPQGLSVAALYDLIFIHSVEPHLIKERPVALMDYPAFVSCLAKKSQDGKNVERWELYAWGIELANCFSEETDTQEVRLFFEKEKAEKERNAHVQHKVDEDYWKLFKNFKKCSGVALGLDRLIMLLCGHSSIDSILPFPMQ